jgi:N-acetylmuramoyl-L-alanine amidase
LSSRQRRGGKDPGGLGLAARGRCSATVGNLRVARFVLAPVPRRRFAIISSFLVRKTGRIAGGGTPTPQGSSCLLCRGFLSLTAVVLLSQALAASALPKWKAAVVAYHKAQGLRATLKRHSIASSADYLRVVRAYQRVYRVDPGYRNAPLALAAAAQVYTKAGRSFADDRYYTKAIEGYRFLIAQYPASRLAQDACFTIAEIYQRDIENPDAARAAYREYLQQYPRSAKAADAAVEIAKINHTLSDWAQARALQAAGAARAKSAPRGGPVGQVQSIRHWLAPHYTRVVIQTGREVRFNAMHLQNPPRLIFDLDNTRVSPQLARKAFPVEHGFLRRVRVAQFKPRVTRVVLDVPQIEDYSVFALQHPFRLVIDVQGQSPRRAPLVGRPVGPASGLEAGVKLGTFARQSGTGGASPGEDGGAIPGSEFSSSDRSRMVKEETADSVAGEDASIAPRTSSEAAVGDVAPTLTRALGLKIRRIVIDPGHGGHDTGTLGPEGLEEKNVVLDVALRLRRLILRKLECQVVMTRGTDEFIPLEERTAIANLDGADLFLSIHANASRDPNARGIETYYLNFTSDPEALAVAARENATSEQSVFQLQSLVRKIALSEKIDESKDFAKIVDRQLTLHLGEDGDRQPDRGIKKAPFVVLIGANMPSILVEISFLTNPRDERLLRSPHFRQEIARALYAGIARYADALGTIRVAQRSAPQSVPHANSSF